MQKIITTGGTGLVLSRFLELYADKYDIENLHFDFLEDLERLTEAIKGSDANVIIHAAAYTDVKLAENREERKKCWRLNVGVTRQIAKIAKELDKKVIYLSTDYVFGAECGPYTESDTDMLAEDIRDISFYGWTKLRGERAVLEHSNSTVVRLSYPFRKHIDPKQKPDLIEKVMTLCQNGKPLFADQYITPSFVDDIADALSLIVEKDLKGVYHVTSPFDSERQTTTPYEFASLFLDKWGEDPNVFRPAVYRGSIHEYFDKNSKERIPVHGGLDSTKIQKEGLKLHTVSEALDIILS